MRRTAAAQIAQANNAIAAAGYYVSPQQVVIDVRVDLDAAIQGTIEYPPQRVPKPKRPLRVVRETRFTFDNAPTLTVAQALAERGLRVAALNFASAKNPGGGYLNGASAQEEYLCRTSLLYHCLEGREMYRFHRAQDDCMYTDWVIYSPDVPVLRDEEGVLFDSPWRCGVLTSPAPNAGVVLRRQPGRRGEVTRALRSRMQKVLSVAAAHGHDALVLGAWGCGVFQNDPAEVAALWDETLRADFRGVFEAVAFAVFSRDERTLSPFEARFGESACLV